jgi:hypothetical protein
MTKNEALQFVSSDQNYVLSDMSDKICCSTKIEAVFFSSRQNLCHPTRNLCFVKTLHYFNGELGPSEGDGGLDEPGSLRDGGRDLGRSRGHQLRLAVLDQGGEPGLGKV